MSSTRNLMYAVAYVPVALTAAVALVADGLDWLIWRAEWHPPLRQRRHLTIAVALAAVVVSVAMNLLPGLDPNTRKTNEVEHSMIERVAAGLKTHGIGARAVRVDPGTNPVFMRERDTLAWGLDQHGIAYLACSYVRSFG